MNRIFVALMLLTGVICGSQVALSQDTTAPTVSDQDIRLMRKDVRSQKKQIIAVNLGLTDAEAMKFWPIYDQYTSEAAKINDSKLLLIKEYADKLATLTDAQAQSIMERWTAADDAVLQLRIKYILIIQTVLPGKKATLFFQLDRRIGILMDLQVASEIPLVEP
jgi:hypothetical protein